MCRALGKNDVMKAPYYIWQHANSYMYGYVHLATKWWSDQPLHLVHFMSAYTAPPDDQLL